VKVKTNNKARLVQYINKKYEDMDLPTDPETLSSTMFVAQTKRFHEHKR